MPKEYTMSHFATKRDLLKAEAKDFINANVWDGEDRSGAKNDRIVFDPDELIELIDELIDSLSI